VTAEDRLEAVAPESRADEAYRLIEERIVTLELAPGAVVTERALCALTGLGRTPVREALVRLRQDHLVTVLPRQGVLIRPIEAEYSLMALELRHLVERLIVTRAAEHATALERDRLHRLADRIDAVAAAGGMVAFMRLDHALNERVAAAARHPVAARTIAPLHAVSRRLGYYFARDTARGLDWTGPAHARLARAIADGDGPAAVVELERLLALTRRIADRILEEAPARAASNAGN